MGRFVFAIVLSGGNAPSPSWYRETGSAMSLSRCEPRAVSDVSRSAAVLAPSLEAVYGVRWAGAEVIRTARSGDPESNTITLRTALPPLADGLATMLTPCWPL